MLGYQQWRTKNQHLHGVVLKWKCLEYSQSHRFPNLQTIFVMWCRRNFSCRFPSNRKKTNLLSDKHLIHDDPVKMCPFKVQYTFFCTAMHFALRSEQTNILFLHIPIVLKIYWLVSRLSLQRLRDHQVYQAGNATLANIMLLTRHFKYFKSCNRMRLVEKCEKPADPAT